MPERSMEEAPADPDRRSSIRAEYERPRILWTEQLEVKQTLAASVCAQTPLDIGQCQALPEA